jgi:hypothetical protein
MVPFGKIGTLQPAEWRLRIPAQRESGHDGRAHMTTGKSKAAAPEPPPRVITAKDPALEEGKLKALGGSRSDDFNSVLVNEVVKTLWTKNSDEAFKDQQYAAVAGGLMGIGPKDELEGMLAAQAMAAHHTAMECYRRAMLPEQPFEAWKENINQANKLSRTYATLLEALNRHRGKGQQKISVEHVHVHAGGQAIVGAVEAGADVASGNQRRPDAKALTHAPVAPLWREDQKRQAVPLAGDAEREMPDARRSVARSSEGEG